MRTIHLDAVGGVAGDMFVAALLDAVPALRARVLADVRAVLPAEIGAAGLAEGMSGAVRVLRFEVHLGALAGHHDHGDDHGAHAHGASFYPDIMARIGAADLAEGTARHASAILTILGETEARIHDVPLSDVHFHEIADWDSLADVVAAGSIVAALGDVGWTISDLPRGSGLVRTQHGLLPVPAPATAAILTGYDLRDDGVGGERVTPTGAAIIRHIGAVSRQVGARRLVATGTGAGTRDLPGLPNILRALVFDDAAGTTRDDRVAVISFDIDDMTGEELADAAERLRNCAGVLDVSMSQAIGKKGRPLTWFRVMAREAALADVTQSCLRQTSTLGLRWHIEDRVVLLREERHNQDGRRVKAATRPDGSVTVKAESDDLRDASDLADRRRRQRQAEEGVT
ncbi:MAG TPA: LarC family nickel insertion protein [Acetobacteraceae bacterium]|jgi:hypothetical protein